MGDDPASTIGHLELAVALKTFKLLVDKWLGVRQDLPPVMVSEKEWVDALNVDDRFGWTRLGSRYPTTTSAELRGYWTYRRPDGTLHEVWVDTSGTIYEDNASVGSGVTLGAQAPSAVSGNGTIVIARSGGRKPWWRDTADGAWKELTGAPFAFDVVGIMSRGPRLVGAPGGVGPDSIAWSAPGNFTDFTTGGTGGVEVIGSDSSPIRILLDGLQDDFAVYKDDEIWVIRGGDPTSWEVIRASTDIGCISATGAVKVGRGHIFVHTSGIYLINSLGQVSWPPLTWKVQPFWDTIKQSALLRLTHISYDSTEQTLWAWVPTASSSGLPFSQLIKIHLPTASVTLHTLSAGASGYHPVSAIMKYSSSTSLLSVGGFTDNGSPINSSITLPILVGGETLRAQMEVHKRWGLRDRIYLLIESRDSATLSLTVAPTIYTDATHVTLTPQTLSVPPNALSRLPVILQPSTIGWGLQLTISGASSAGGWRLVGVSGMYEDISDLRDA